MINIKNKKGKEGIFVTILNPTFIFAIMALILFFYFLKSGGGDIVSNITEFLKSIPPIAYVVFGIILLFLMSGKRRRRR